MRRAAEKLLVRPVIDELSNEAIRRGREIEDLVEHGIVRLNLQLQLLGNPNLRRVRKAAGR